LANQKAELETIALNLGIGSDLSLWYTVSNKRFIECGGGVLLTHYNHSLSKLLMALIPDHKWDVLRFQSRPRNYLSSFHTQSAALKVPSL